VTTALSELTGLSSSTAFCCANALNMPFRDESFHLTWTQHIQMNIDDKSTFYRQVRRVLQPAGRFVIHDILAGPSGPPHFPVRWADEPGLLEQTGFRVERPRPPSSKTSRGISLKTGSEFSRSPRKGVAEAGSSADMQL
jgi:ubiquinone/menaquinone biosynthesis C-methylase UbiE